jgi:hypothetical protein
MLTVKTTDIALGAAMPFKAFTLDFLQLNELTNNKFILETILNGSSSSYYVCYGLQNTIVGSVNTITSGLVYYQGSFYYVTGATITLGVGESVYLNLTETFPYISTAADPVTFSDGTTHYVYAGITLVLANATSGTVAYNSLVFLQNPTRQVGTIATVQWEDGAGGTTFNYYKVPFNKLVIDTQLQKASAGTATIITLPVGYRPASDRYFITMGGAINANTLLKFKIDTAGAVTLVTSSGTLGLGTGDIYDVYAEIPLY